MQTIQKPVEVNLTPVEVAILFASLDNREMAEFFNEVAAQVKTWEAPLEFQMQDVLNTGMLTDEACAVMKVIGDYSYPVLGEPAGQVVAVAEVHGWNKERIQEVIRKVSGLCGPNEVLVSLVAYPAPITEDDVIMAIRDNEPF